MTNGGVRHHQVELLPLDGVEHRPLAQVPRGGERGGAERLGVEGLVERGEGQRAARYVGRDHLARVQRGVQRLHPAPRPQVQHAAHRRAHRHPREREGRAADPEHVILAQPRAGHGLAAIRRDPPAGLSPGPDGRVGAQVDQGAHGIVPSLARRLDQAGLDRSRGAHARQGAIELGARHRVAQQEEPGEDGRWEGRCPGREARGQHLFAREGTRGALADHRLDRVDGPALEGRAQGAGGGGREGGDESRCHGSRLARLSRVAPR